MAVMPNISQRNSTTDQRKRNRTNSRKLELILPREVTLKIQMNSKTITIAENISLSFGRSQSRLRSTSKTEPEDRCKIQVNERKIGPAHCQIWAESALVAKEKKSAERRNAELDIHG
jgi:hypothetical protein